MDLELAQRTYLKVSLEQVFVETSLFPLLDSMKLTMSMQDYSSMQSEASPLWNRFHRNETTLRYLTNQINSYLTTELIKHCRVLPDIKEP